MHSTSPSKLILQFTALAALSFGASHLQGAGVIVGSSTLIGALDYSDTFTGTASGSSNPNRPYIAALQPAPCYVVENTYGHPSVNFQSPSQGPGIAEWSIASDGAGLVNGVPGYPGTSGAGSATGFTQTGGGMDYGVPYGFRTNYVVQVDAVKVGDRIDISSGGGYGIGAPSSLSIFFRGDGSGNASLYNGAVDTPIQSLIPTFNTGLNNTAAWVNYAVRFDSVNKQIELYVNQVSKGVINLNTFAGGIYANFTNSFVGVGAGLAGGENRTWTDNFQVGGAIPEPGTAMLGLSTLGGLLLRRRRR